MKGAWKKRRKGHEGPKKFWRPPGWDAREAVGIVIVAVGIVIVVAGLCAMLGCVTWPLVDGEIATPFGNVRALVTITPKVPDWLESRWVVEPPGDSGDAGASVTDLCVSVEEEKGKD